MNRRVVLGLLGVLLCVLSLVGEVHAMSSTNYAIPWSVVGGGGEASTSTHYGVNATIGQGVVGLTSGASHQVGAGYWYGLIWRGIGGIEIYLPFLVNDG